MLLATACGSKPREGVDFFPLSVDYEERLYAAGRIPGSFQRREGRPTDQAILVSRLIDRPLRPLFPKGMMNEVQVIVTALARDPEIHLDTMSIIGASAAMTISNIPWEGPIGAVRVGFIDGQIIINPTVTQMASSTLDLRMAGTADAILMVEAGADELPEDMMLEALKLGHEAMQPIIELQNKMRAELGKPKFEFTPVLSDQAVEAAATAWLGDRVRNAIAQNPGKEAQYKALADAKPLCWPRWARRMNRRRWPTRSRASRSQWCASASSAKRFDRMAAATRRSARSAWKSASCRAAWHRPLHPRRDSSADGGDVGHARRHPEA